jgi:hypothetical protein
VSLPSLPQLYPTYIPRDEQRWLREVLSHQVSGARILTYQYEFARNKDEMRWGKLVDEADELLYELMQQRQEVTECDRPISKYQR